MSTERGDATYKPRFTRGVTYYCETVVLTDTEEETKGEEGSDLDLSDRGKKLTPTQSFKSGVSWTPSTIGRKTDNVKTAVI